ncbi:MAG: DUF3644 domain-containing protein [Bacteroidota bacterium]
MDKSVNSMLSAIEIYNKPNFSYREETFAILATNAVELLFKAQLLKASSYQMKSLYVLEPIVKKDGSPHKTRKKPKLSRSKNPMTISLFDVIKKLEEKGFKISPNHLASIEALVELRDNAIHFHNEKFISKEIQELGFATIKNYLHIIKKWGLEVDLSAYNFYLMPLAYVDSKLVSDGVITEEVKNYLSFVKAKIDGQDKEDEEFDIAISIDINFSKTNSFEGIGFKYDPDGVPITISEEDIRKKFPLTYDEVRLKAKDRYSNFKQNQDFNQLMKKIKKDNKLHHERKLDPNNPKSLKKAYYSTNIWKEFDKFYKKK